MEVKIKTRHPTKTHPLLPARFPADHLLQLRENRALGEPALRPLPQALVRSRRPVPPLGEVRGIRPFREPPGPFPQARIRALARDVLVEQEPAVRPPRKPGIRALRVRKEAALVARVLVDFSAEAEDVRFFGFEEGLEGLAALGRGDGGGFFRFRRSLGPENAIFSGRAGSGDANTFPATARRFPPASVAPPGL